MNTLLSVLSIILLNALSSESIEPVETIRIPPNVRPEAVAQMFLNGDLGRPAGDINIIEMMNVTIIFGVVDGLPPGPHGFHVHRDSDLGNGCQAAGPHYNPLNMNHGFHNMARHVGDLGNLFTWPKENGTSIHVVDTVVSINPNNEVFSIIGRTFVIHVNEDDLGLGGNAESLITGNAGGRLACGIIRRV